MSFSYPPYREPISDLRTGRVTRAWQRFFDNLISGLVDLGTQVTGTLGLTYLPEPIRAPASGAPLVLLR